MSYVMDMALWKTQKTQKQHYEIFSPYGFDLFDIHSEPCWKQQKIHEGVWSLEGDFVKKQLYQESSSFVFAPLHFLSTHLSYKPIWDPMAFLNEVY